MEGRLWENLIPSVAGAGCAAWFLGGGGGHVDLGRGRSRQGVPPSQIWEEGNLCPGKGVPPSCPDLGPGGGIPNRNSIVCTWYAVASVPPPLGVNRLKGLMYV